MMIEYIGWALLGFVAHILTKIANAKRVKKDFSVGVFIERNFWQYLSSLVLIIIGCALLPMTDFHLSTHYEIDLVE